MFHNQLQSAGPGSAGHWLLSSKRSTIFCPNGAASSSPGLPRAAALPWVGVAKKWVYPNGVAASLGLGLLSRWLNPVGVERCVSVVPKVAAARQPWALGRSPVGARSGNAPNFKSQISNLKSQGRPEGLPEVVDSDLGPTPA